MLNNELIREIEQSGWIHFPLPLHEERGLEAEIAKKQVLDTRVIWENEKECAWQNLGRGETSVVWDEAEGKYLLRMEAPSHYSDFPNGLPDYADYSNYGRLQCCLPVDREDWRGYNRFSLRIRPDFPAREHVTVIAAVFNDGEVKVPDPYHREGYHVINVINHEWNEINWEFPDLDRDCVTGVYLYAFLNGDNGECGDYVRYDFDAIRLEKVEEPEYALGWQGNKNRILYATAGYEKDGKKTAIATADCDTFTVINEAGESVLTKEAVLLENEKGTFRLLDFSAVTEPGVYTLVCGAAKSRPFAIGEGIFDSAILKSVSFLFGERCGHPVPGVHGACHLDAYAEFEGKKLPYHGGWHDAGDMSQQTLQSAEIAHSLLLNANRTADPLMKARILEEALWGIDFALRTRFGNGYHATSAGVTRYTDNIVGTFEDIPNVRVNNPMIDNFLYGGIFADTAISLKPTFAGRAVACLKAAEEDFAAAMALYREQGVNFPAQVHEHTLPLGPSSYYAAACWGASRLFAATGKEEYAEIAREFAAELLACQEKGGAGIALTGFFWREKEHRRIVHHNHQSREHLFMQALTTLLETQPDHADAPLWKAAVASYGEYVKAIYAECAPYGMIPAGVYQADEGEDAALFARTNPGSNYELERPNYAVQVKAGKALGGGFYLRHFPVWFSFRGNAAVNLSAGAGAAMAGKYLGDKALIEIGREQLYWTLGKNPFGQSIMYGEGERYPQLYATSSGELCGELPVGIEAFNNTDLPYWPQGNNCTYKEIWTSPTGRFLLLTASL